MIFIACCLFLNYLETTFANREHFAFKKSFTFSRGKAVTFTSLRFMRMNRENNNTIVLFGGNMSEFRKSVSLVSNTCFSLLASGATSLFTIPPGTYSARNPFEFKNSQT